MTTENQSGDALQKLIGFEVAEVVSDSVTLTLTVDERHLRPGGIMNGGISLLLIETAGSFSSYNLIDKEKQNTFGIQVSANHLAVALPGDKLTIKTEAVHVGRSTHVWDVMITNEKGKKVSSGRITLMIASK